MRSGFKLLFKGTQKMQEIKVKHKGEMKYEKDYCNVCGCFRIIKFSRL